jgi:putative endonuclease
MNGSTYMKDDGYFVYMMTNKNNTVIYVDTINHNILELLSGVNDFLTAFTKDHKINKLVYYENTDGLEKAFKRQEELRALSRNHKNRLVEKNNPGWKNLIHQLVK